MVHHPPLLKVLQWLSTASRTKFKPFIVASECLLIWCLPTSLLTAPTLVCIHPSPVVPIRLQFPNAPYAFMPVLPLLFPLDLPGMFLASLVWLAKQACLSRVNSGATSFRMLVPDTPAQERHILPASAVPCDTALPVLVCWPAFPRGMYRFLGAATLSSSHLYS